MNLDPDRLYRIFSNERFLSMQGLSGEEAIFIQTYDVADEDSVAATVRSLATRLRNSGISVAEVDLFGLVLEEMKAGGILDDFLTEESSYDPGNRAETLENYADAEQRIAPRLLRVMAEAGARLSFLCGAGHVYPFLRAHTLLDCTQQVEFKHPVVLFYPGDYIQVPGKGSQLQLFGTMPSDGYYRARNLDHYRL